MNETVAKRVKVFHEGDLQDAEEVAFDVLEEMTGKYMTSDGAEISLTHNVKNVFRLCDKKKEDGQPIYILAGGVTFTTINTAGKQ